MVQEEGSEQEVPPKQARALSMRMMRFFLFLARILPRRFGYWLADVAARLGATFFPGRRRLVESNLVPVLGTDDPRLLRPMSREICRHFARAYYEVLYLPSLPAEEVAKIGHMEGWDTLVECYERGRGVILVTTHQSSFDTAGQVIAARGLPMNALAMPDQEGGLGVLNEMRKYRGVRPLTGGPRALREVFRVLRNGEILVVAGDRPAGDNQGTVVDFFGRPTLLPDGHVRLAQRTGAAVVTGFCCRENNEYRFVVEPVELINTGDEEQDVRENVQLIARLMEKAIRAHPEQWHLLRRLWE